MTSKHDLAPPLLSAICTGTLTIPLLFESVSFGTVVLSNALEHVTETQRTIRGVLDTLFFLGHRIEQMFAESREKHYDSSVCGHVCGFSRSFGLKRGHHCS